jgi:hypothetical protein
MSGTGAMNKQRGLTLSAMIVTSFIVVLGSILAFKLVPVYLEYQTIKRIFKSMAEDPALRSARRGELERSWAARTAIDDVKSLAGENIEYTKDADGLVVSADYSVKVRLVGNASLCLDFHPTSK